MKRKYLFLLSVVILLASCRGQEQEYPLTYDSYDIAILRSDIETLEKCLNAGIETLDKALFDAADMNNEEVVRYLLEKGADVNYIHTFNNLNGGSSPSMDALLISFTNWNVVDASLRSPAITQLLIDHGAQAERTIGPDANTIMGYIQYMYGFHQESDREIIVQSMRILLENGANPNFRSENGYSPLMLALNYGLRGAVDVLLEFGAVPSKEPIRIEFNYDPLGFKEWDENYGVTWQTEFLLLANCGYHDILIPYIEKGIISPDHADPDGHDMYYWAAEGGDPWMMKALLRYLEDINSKLYTFGNYQGASLLHIASSSGNIETAKVLLQNGIDTTIKAIDEQGTSYIAYQLDGFYRGISRVIVDYKDRGERYPEYQVQR
jgi:ankyrin repeat protein